MACGSCCYEVAAKIIVGLQTVLPTGGGAVSSALGSIFGGEIKLLCGATISLPTSLPTFTEEETSATVLWAWLCSW